MEKEIWKPIKNYEDLYEVSNTGKVRSKTKELKMRNKYSARNMEKYRRL